MSERFLRSITITDAAFDPDVVNKSDIEDIEIWTTKSKVVHEQLSSIGSNLEFVALIDPAYTPIWAIVDKPYNVYTSNDKSLELFEKLANNSVLSGSIIRNAILTKIGNESYLLFYIERNEDKFVVNCLLLEISLNKFKEIVNKDHGSKDDSDTYFIDDLVDKKDDLIDTLLKQKSINFSNLNPKRQAELHIKQQQFQRSQIRQDFRKIIVKSVKARMSSKPKPLQTEVAEVCFKGMCHKFRDTLETNNEILEEMQKWLEIFLDVLGE